MDTEHWAMKRLRMQKKQPAPIRFLLWLGLVRLGRRSTEVGLTASGEIGYVHPVTIRWPFHVPPMHIFKHCLRTPGQRIYVFRNLPGVIKWLPGRLLPHRWGFGICGFEFGDRGH